MTIIQKAEQYVFDLFKDKLSSAYTYHNFNHTLRVAAAVEKIIESEKVSDDEETALKLAAWFHDTGYIHGPENHEDKSVKILQEFLEKESVSDTIQQLAEQLIRVTEMTKEPKSKPENIIRDADCSHFGKKNFAEISESLRQEWQVTLSKTYSDTEWLLGNRTMLTQYHRFYTEYAKKKWQKQKDKNITEVQEKIDILSAGKELKPEKKKKDKDNKPEKGIETMFRVTLNNHTQLSQIADSKANILLSVNAIIISIALSSIIPKLDSPTNAHLIVPTFIMLLFSVISIVFAILSTRPKVTQGTFTREDIQNQKVNLLFFGNFYKVPMDEYLWAMNEMMKDKKYLYDSMIKDLYYLGLVLHRKYKLLRITYNVFMFGIVFSVICFVIAFKRASL